jgi:hypothetical protein
MPGTVQPGNGGLSALIKAAHDMLIGSASWRAYMIAAHDDLTNASPPAAFLKYVREYDSVDDGIDYDDTEIQSESNPNTDEIDIGSIFPFVTLYEEDDFTWAPIAQCSTAQFEIAGTVSLVFTDYVYRYDTDAPGLYDAKMRFANWIDGLLADWNGTVLPTNITTISLVGAIQRQQPTGRAVSDFWEAKLAITFGTNRGGSQ